jgi:Uma2 family endonuclease
MERKFKLYHKAGVREYWIVDPENKGLTVHCFNGSAISASTYGNIGTVPVSILPGFDITLDEVFTE